MTLHYSLGIDVGSSAIKSVLATFDEVGEVDSIRHKNLTKLRKRDTKEVVGHCVDTVLDAEGIRLADIDYIATTGEGDMVDFRRGHFYSMTCHSRGALYLDADVRAVVDVGALHAKALIMDERSKVLNHRMTSQCASGSGQFLENISRYLGIGQAEIGELSIQAEAPEVVSSICAVLAETDVINMVSRGIAAANILRGIHLSMAGRIVRLLRALRASGDVLVTGGLAHDAGFTHAMQELADKEKLALRIRSHEDSVFAGALGAAIWGAFRHVKLLERDRGPAARMVG